MHHYIDMTKKGEAYALRHQFPAGVHPLNPMGAPAGVEPRLWRKVLSDRVETHLALATALLSVLDGLDGDCDLEDGGDLESSLGGAELQWQVDLELDECDNEPSLGWGRWHELQSQALIATEIAFDADLEDEHDGAEPDDEGDGEPDLEPSLGAPEIGPTASYSVSAGKVFTFRGSQERWANGTPGASDLEEESVNEDGDPADCAA